MAMPRSAVIVVVSFLLFNAVARGGVEQVDNPFYGQVLYDSYLQKYFSSITHLEKELDLGRLGSDSGQAEALLGSLYLSFGLHRHAQAIFDKLSENSADPAARNLAWFYLARLEYQRGLYREAAGHLDKISAPLAGNDEHERVILTALLDLRLKDYPAAIEVLNDSTDASKGLSYGRFNLALARLDHGEQEKGTSLLEEMSSQAPKDAEAAFLRDRINVGLGFKSLEKERFETAQGYFKRVQAQGPFSNKALLGLGWAAFGKKDYARAESSWRKLAARDRSDTSVLEALLALPYLAYEQKRYSDALTQYSQAAEVYDAALKSIDAQLARKDFSAVLAGLEDARGSDANYRPGQGESLSGPLANRYMLSLIAGNRFQAGLKNCRDLLFLERNLRQWQHAIDVFSDIIDSRQAVYAELRPRAQQLLKQLADEDLEKEIRDLRVKVAYVELDGDAMALISATEEEKLQRLNSIDYHLAYNLSELRDKLDHHKLVDRTHAMLKKHDFLEGLLKWDVMTSYPARLSQMKQKLDALEADSAKTVQLRQDINRILQSIPSSFDDQRRQLQAISHRVEEALKHIADLRHEHEQYLYGLIRERLSEVRKNIELYRSQALVSVAHIYDLNLKLQERKQ